MHSHPLIADSVRVLGVLAVLREHPRKRSLDQVVDAFVADCRACNLSPRTIDHYESAIRSFRATVARGSCGSVLPGADGSGSCCTARLPRAS